MTTGAIDLKLGSMREILGALDDPQDKVKSIHVAGTNGKGSVCSMLASMLILAGNRVSMFCSPHLNHYTERLLIQGAPVSEERLLKALQTIFEKEQELNLQLSYFEAIIAASFLISAQEKLDWMVVEVGLGGRLDATNVMASPRLSVITSIGFDHMAVLGNTEYLIAREKAGIFQPGTPALVGHVSQEARSGILEVATDRGVEVKFLNDPPAGIESSIWPAYKLWNTELARHAGRAIGLTEEIIQEGIDRAEWPGRLEQFSTTAQGQEKHFLVDGAHNPAGIQGLLEFLSKTPASEIFFLLSILQQKDYKTMTRLLRAWAENERRPVRFFTCRMKHEGGADLSELTELLNAERCFDTSEQAFDWLQLQLPSDALGVITGSLYFISEVRKLLTNRPFSTIRV